MCCGGGAGEHNASKIKEQNGPEKKEMVCCVYQTYAQSKPRGLSR